MSASPSSPLIESLRALAAQPGVEAAGLWDRAAASLTCVDREGRGVEEAAATRVLVEAVLAAAGALAQGWQWGAPRELRLACAEGGLLLHHLEDGRCLVLRHRAEAPSARLGLALREAAASLPAGGGAREESGLPAVVDFAVFDEKKPIEVKSAVYNPFTTA